jgi:plastocyanin
MMKKMALTLVAALSLGVLAGCGSSNTATGTKLDVTAGEGGALTYNPATLTAKVGTPVTVHLVNKDSANNHTFIIKDLNVSSKQVAPGKTEDINFTPSKAGTFDYHCDIPGHEATMKGTITVSN